MTTINYCRQQPTQFYSNAYITCMNNSLFTCYFKTKSDQQRWHFSFTHKCVEFLRPTNELPNNQFQTCQAPVPDLPPWWIHLRWPPVYTVMEWLSGKQWMAKAVSDSSSWEVLCVCLPERRGNQAHACHAVSQQLTTVTSPNWPLCHTHLSTHFVTPQTTVRLCELDQSTGTRARMSWYNDEAGGTPVRQNGNINSVAQTCGKKGPLKRLIRPGQADRIKTWWDNRSVQTEPEFEWMVIQ